MPQHKLEQALLQRQPRDPRQGTWDHGTKGDPEEALNLDDSMLALLMKINQGQDVELPNMLPTPENNDIAGELQGARFGITQQLFDKLRGSKWASEQRGTPALEGYDRKYFDQEKK